MTNKKHSQTFDEFDSADTKNWPPPKFIAQPAQDDKGFEITKSFFNNMTTHFKPGIADDNLDLPEKK